MYALLISSLIIYGLFFVLYIFYDVYLFKSDGEDFSVLKEHWHYSSYFFIARMPFSYLLCLSMTSVRNIFFHDIAIVLAWIFYIVLPFYISPKSLFVVVLINFFTLLANIIRINDLQYATFWDYLALPQYIFYKSALKREEYEI